MINKFDGKYAFLSNFFIDTLPFLSVENRYQARKSLDPNQQNAILIATTPALAKKMGSSRGIKIDGKLFKIVLRPDWEEIKREVMWHLIWEKFQVPFLKELLLATDDQELIEGNYWHDNYWGACICQKCISKEKHNHLGKLLMYRREWAKRNDITLID